jgi:hypothetical protein
VIRRKHRADDDVGKEVRITATLGSIPSTRPKHAELGKVARVVVPRSAHAAFEPDAKRPDPVDIIERQSAARVPELVPIRCGRRATVARQHADQPSHRMNHDQLTDALGHVGRG